MNNYVVIGSGPSGVSSALALLRNGSMVTMLDFGNNIPQSILEKVWFASQKSPDLWTADEVKFLKFPKNLGGGVIPTKTLFGSDFIYQDNDYVFGNNELPSGFSQYPSFAYGGLSRVWGAASMRLYPSDYASWPINNLEYYYKIIEDLIPISAGNDDSLADNFGFPRKSHSVPPSKQSKAVIDKLSKNTDALKKMGVSFGQSRLAIRPDCLLCLNCLQGCPYGKIFSSIDLMPELHTFPNFKYIGNVKVQTFKEDSASVSVLYLDSFGVKKYVNADRIFLGSGVLSTAQIVLNSLGLKDYVLHMKDSQYFMMPFIGPRYIKSDKTHSLSQIFIESNNAEISPYNIHTQLYGFNDLYEEEILSSLGILRHMPGAVRLANMLSYKFYVAQSYLHSNDSVVTSLSLQQGTQHSPLKISVPTINDSIKNQIHKVWSHLSKVGKLGGIYGLPLLGRISDVGQGYHSGGTMSMSKDPIGAQSDIFGRPFSLNRVHVVDSSILPTIPSGTITLTVMANSYRIASSISLKDGGG